MSRALSWLPMLTTVAACGIWIALARIAPDTLRWLALGSAPNVEARIETLEHLVVLACSAAWIAIAVRVRDRRAALVVALFLVAQLVLILLEETDWGASFGAPRILPDRNLRQTLRNAGLLPRALDPKGMVAIMAIFLLSPLVPSARVRRMLDRMAPVRATPSEGAAAIVAVVAYILTDAVLPRTLISMELLQSCVYLVFALTTVRIALEVWRT